MKVLFLHGLEGSPNGRKATYLKERYGAVVPELPTDAVRAYLESEGGLVGGALPRESYLDALEVATLALLEEKPDVVVGSSFGGGLAALLAHSGLFLGPMVLLAPAAFKFEIDKLEHAAPVVVIHGSRDDVIPLARSKALVARSGSNLRLFEVDDGHRLSNIAHPGGPLDEALAFVMGKTK